MLTTRSEFARRLSEIDSYFSVLSPLDSCSCVFESRDLSGTVSRLTIDEELSKILKANGFILLYNLLEATVRNSIKAIGNVIESEGIKYQDFSENLKRLWINHSFKSVDAQRIKHETIGPILDQIVNNEFLRFEEDAISFSGNIDAQKIREIAKRIGYKAPKDGRELVTIKEKRNQLAHGEKTFCEIGRNFTVGELVRLKDAMTSYISEVLDNVQDYIDTKAYRI